ncbi:MULTISPECIES: hypothetical protein [unclassified Mesorhizobium]|uniref:hypothetical protein n=1 Tax=unclassified Mesorhizobium TaxID=325217 RepID=UPI001FE209DF|nr:MULTISPECIES: hypothetical protein [unclassified Mesorhizobium]
MGDCHVRARLLKVEKHGTKSRRSWRKLPLALDADSGEIIAALTGQDTRNARRMIVALAHKLLTALRRMDFSWSGSATDPTEYKVAAHLLRAMVGSPRILSNQRSWLNRAAKMA